MEIIRIKTEYIELAQFLKYVGLAQTGGEAKYLIETENITVNSEVEKRRGKKLYPNDVIVVGTATYKISNENN